MTLTRKDGLATVLTALAVLAFVATHQAWDVWLIGSSHHWAAVAVTLLGSATCALGSASQELSEGSRPGSAVMALAGVGAVAGVLAIVAIATGSLTALSLLVLSIVVLWAGSTLRHAWHPTHHPVAT
ncbi:MAG TPA: hypothetical protein VFO26_01430 [Gaiella sp.]|uniref:hypothetical protein n=1 Tax=Gaiella sp. TaxID=2663207 RepID=UPI002D7F263A|nr:hypothetical protein [Gaiella sp.]HET9286193.1 hypothetical protein [Gaiella sp.]